MPEPILLTCESLAYHEDILGDLLPAGAFRHHAHNDLPADEQCHCAEPVPWGEWDEGNVLDRNRACQSTTTVERPGFVLVVCCRCFDTADVDGDVLAEAGRRVAEEQHRLARAVASLPPSAAARLEAELEASNLLLAAGYPADRVAAAGRALHEVTR